MGGRELKTTGSRTGAQDFSSLALTAARLGEFEWNIERGELSVSARMAAITGMTHGVTRAHDGQRFLDHVHPEDRAALLETMNQGLRVSDRYDARFRLIRPDNGREIWLNAMAVAIRGEQGDLLRTVGAVRDVSTEKGEANQSDALVAELDHRVKNVLAAVQSLAAQSARRTVSLDAFLKTFFGRLEAMAAAHTLLTATRWRGAEISQIAAAELGGLALGQARWAGPDVILNPRATHALTLALHELSANAVKHGALSSEGGHIEVKWERNPSGGFELFWIESGGPIVARPSRRGFGSTLLERVTGPELGGTAFFDFRPEGLKVTLNASASALAAAPNSSSARAPLNPAPPTGDMPGASHGGAVDADIRGLRVLIVEDAVLLAVELESGLTESGAVVVGLAADLDKALSMLDLRFDVAVLDANLNGRSVLPMANALAARSVPFIFATGYGDAGAAPEGFTAPVVRKPYNIRQIAAALVGAMESRSSTR